MFAGLISNNEMSQAHEFYKRDAEGTEHSLFPRQLVKEKDQSCSGLGTWLKVAAVGVLVIGLIALTIVSRTSLLGTLANAGKITSYALLLTAGVLSLIVFIGKIFKRATSHEDESKNVDVHVWAYRNGYTVRSDSSSDDEGEFTQDLVQ